MAVIEIGVIFNGVPIYVNTFNQEKDEKDDSAIILKSALLSAIQSTIQMLYGEESKEFKFKKYRILLEFIKDNHNAIIYAVADLDSKIVFPIKEMLKELCSEVNELSYQKKINQFDKKKNFKILDPIATNLFSDLKKSALDRLNELL